MSIIVNMGKYILDILRSQLMVMLSWGVSSIRALKNDEGLIFHVEGFKFNGWVKVVYSESDDAFNIFYITNDGQTQKIQECIYLDMLVDTIDEEVEKTKDYENDVRQSITNLLK